MDGLTYEDNCDHCKGHDCSALFCGFLGLLDGLPRLDDRNLLLLQSQKIVQLVNLCEYNSQGYLRWYMGNIRCQMCLLHSASELEAPPCLS